MSELRGAEALPERAASAEVAFVNDLVQFSNERLDFLRRTQQAWDDAFRKRCRRDADQKRRDEAMPHRYPGIDKALRNQFPQFYK